MSTVPSSWVAVALNGDPDLTQAAARYQVRVGERLEVDLDVLERADPGLGRHVRSGLAARAGQTWVVDLIDHVQKASGAGKVDLGEVYTALAGLPSTAGLCAVALRTEPDMEAVAVLAGAGGGSLQGALGDFCVTIPVAAVGLPGCLGGPARPGEQQRHLVISVRHANWRDRQVRRLARVQVQSVVRIGADAVGQLSGVHRGT